MGEKSIPPKSKEERYKEAEKLKAETYRSIEAARMKLAHGLIEDIEKQRKLSSVNSLKERINIHLKDVLDYAEGIISHKMDLSLSFAEKELTREAIRNYELIREDFREIMEMNNEKLEKLFPKLATHFENRVQASVILTNLVMEEMQMKAYSLRMIP